jgi:hypothetical protein
MVKVTPFGELWSAETRTNPSAPLQALAANFQNDVLANVRSLTVSQSGSCPGAMGADINRITYPVDIRFDDAQSLNTLGGSSDFRSPSMETSLPPSGAFTFGELLAASAGTCGLTSRQLVARAMTQTCAGCHDAGHEFGLSTDDAIGPVLLPDGTTRTKWPVSLGFVHTKETPALGVHELSPALKEVFLPERRRIAVDEMLNQDTCPCREQFMFEPDKTRHQFVSIEDKVTSKFAPRLRKEIERLQALKPSGSPKAPQAAEVRQARRRLRAVELEREQAVVKAVAEAGRKLPPLDRKLSAQATSFGFKQLAEGDPKRAAELRQSTTNQFLRAEPPRRTVSGSFRAH